MVANTVIVAVASYLVMVVAYRWHKKRGVHVPVMISIMLFDLSMPFYLYSTRDWKTRLIDDGDILSFLVWTHIGLLVALFVLYFLQIAAGRKLMQNNEEAREEHRSIAKGLLLVRGLVILSGALLVQPEHG